MERCSFCVETEESNGWDVNAIGIILQSVRPIAGGEDVHVVRVLERVRTSDEGTAELNYSIRRPDMARAITNCWISIVPEATDLIVEQGRPADPEVERQAQRLSGRRPRARAR